MYLLVTSRESLFLGIELRHAVRPLEVPDISMRLLAADVRQTPAVDLFLARAAPASS